MSNIYKTKYILNSSKESNIDIMDYDMAIDGVEFSNKKAKDKFIYTAYQVVFDIEIDLDTGVSKITHINGVKISETVEL